MTIEELIEKRNNLQAQIDGYREKDAHLWNQYKSEEISFEDYKAASLIIASQISNIEQAISELHIQVLKLTRQSGNK